MKFKKIFSKKNCLLAIIIFTCIYLYFFLNQIINNLPDVRKIKNIQLRSPVKIFYNNQKLSIQFNIHEYHPITIKNFPKKLIQTFLIVEDSNFYIHHGFDLKGIIRAISNMIISGHISQGASTITQQLARNFFLSSEKNIIRKIKEILLAIKIENFFSKKEILELYLNKICLGENCYGVSEAAKKYFNKTLNQLTLSETAILAGLPKNPFIYNPIKSIKKTKKRRDIILKRMLYKNIISKKEYNIAKKTIILNNSHYKLIHIKDN
ncbi:hypothetical protein GJT84_01840 [Enterobacteriaceae endosymbiont of Plateumaris sericea]|uniref:transglycosylase domain-containing protein n=1 Tax=Enterobacteriaceae endosymbiont of Plateumaris sericea TaxID=2675797 RepID=UPI001449FF1C|nr:transglycosylase domain-containing protein [Enterobacteriaceae endosymbiont of Plateumaris sericea]QJC30074.1 hypothetical protein GJT84_01840 [Enterobacteriaceae endosymbiont of Plateumaris sericea]